MASWMLASVMLSGTRNHVASYSVLVVETTGRSWVA